MQYRSRRTRLRRRWRGIELDGVEGLVSSSAAVSPAAGSRVLVRALYGPGLTLAAGLCAAGPVLAAVARGLHEGWQPVADRGIIATRSFDVFSSHMPLVGQYSFAGAVTGKLTYSLGPMLYWLLAPAAHVGAPASFVVTMGVVNVGCVLGAVALARRRGGAWLMVATAVGIALLCRSLAANNFYDIWNPSAGLFPLLALIFVCWSLACGDWRLAPVAALLASFLLQLEDSFVPTALAAGAVGLGGAVLWWLRARRMLSARERKSARRWTLGALVVVAICWTPTVVDEVAHEGNFGHVLQAATERKSSLGTTVGVHAVVRTVGIKPWWLVRSKDPFSRKRDVLRSSSTLANVSGALILGWLLLSVALALRRRRADVVAAATLALLLCAAVFSVASATPTKRMLAETLGYTLWSASTVGMFTWLVALWALVVLTGADRLLAGVLTPGGARRRQVFRGRRPHAPRAPVRALPALLGGAVALALAGAAGAAGAAAGQPDEHAFEFAAITAINSRLGAVPRGHSVYLNARLDGLITPLRPELTYDLRRRHVRALGVGAYLRTGHWYELHEHPYDYIVWVYDNGRPPVRNARVIASGHITSGGRPHTVEVAISPATPKRVHRPRAPGARASNAAGAGSRADLPLRAWSAPRTVTRCAAAPPAVVFPSDAPAVASGAGALVWASTPGGCGSAGAQAGGASVSVAPLDRDDRTRPPLVRAPGGQAPLSLQAVGGSMGRISVASLSAPGEGAPGGGYVVLQGRARARPARVLGGRASALSLARAYLGDVAVAAATSAPAIVVRVQRYYRAAFETRARVAVARSPVSALTATMDYRSDVLVAWQQQGAIFAHMLRASGRAEPTQRLGPSGPAPQLSALVSDNDHGMVAWSDTSPATHGARTTIYVDLSAAGVRFGAPERVASFADPALAGRQAGSLALVRLSSENVMMAWTQRERGRYVVRAAPAVYAATRPSALLSDARAQSLLSDLAAGPAGEAVPVWRSSPGATFDASHAQLWSTRAFIARHDRPAALPAQLLSGAGANAGPHVAVDPATDSAVAAWLAGATHPVVKYATAAGASGYRPRPLSAALPAKRAGTHWLRIVAAALAGAALLAAAALLMVRRRRRVAR
jgi:hypothetical protein